MCAGGTTFFLSTTDKGITDLNLDSRSTDKGGILVLTNTYGFFDDWRRAKSFVKSGNFDVINDLSQVNICSDEFLNILTESKLSVLSFGPEKYVAGISGGALIINKKYIQQNKNIQSILDDVSCARTDAVFLKIIQRVKYILTFQTIGTILYGVLARLHLVNLLTDTKLPESYIAKKEIIPLRMHTSQIISILFRVLYYQWEKEREVIKYKLLVQQIEQMISVVGKDVQTAPLHLIIRVAAEKRHTIAKFLSKNGFQTTWNYIPLFHFKPFKNYTSHSDQNNFWREVMQIPYRSLSEIQIKKLAETLIYAHKNI
jgi:dTDP-4-amino-4,6-dideoxygalactose transaminase